MIPQSAPGVGAPAGGGRSPFRSVAFRWFFAGRLVSLLGGSMAPVALAFAVLGVSGRAGDLGLVLAAHTVPLIAFVLLGGSVADRFSKGVVLWVSNLGAGLTQGVVAGLLILGHYDLVLVMVLEFCSGTLAAFTSPALRGVVPELVDKGSIQKANSLLSSARNGARVLGPTVAGVLVVTAGGGWAIAIDAVSFLIAALCMAKLDLPAKVAAGGGSVWTDLRDGWQVFRSTTWVWSVVGSFSLLNCIQVGVWSVLGPAIAMRTVGETSWGVVLSVEALGVLLMAVVMYRLVLRRLLAVGQVAVALTALPLIVLGVQGDVNWLVAAGFVAGLGSGLFGIAWDTSLQEHVPVEMLSRVASYDEFGSYVGIPVGQLAVVPLALAFGDAQVALVGGILFAVIALLPLATSSVRQLRHAS